MADRIIVFGGSNVDFIAESNRKLIPEDSNPGKVRVSFGGVGRNITENLARLHDDVTFFTGLGNDTFGAQILKELSDLGVKVMYPKPKTESSSYVAIAGQDGEMKLAICDSRAIDNLTINFVIKDNVEIRERDYLIMETNLSNRMIADLFHVFPDKKWCVEAVSVEKAKKVIKFLSNIWLLKGNLIELRGLIENGQDLNAEEVCSQLISKGVKNVVISDKMNPIVFGNKDGIEKLEITPASNVINSTGAGDALFSGIIHCINLGMTLKEGVDFGHKLAEITLKSQKAVSDKIDTSLKA